MSLPEKDDPRIVNVKFWVNGELVATWDRGDFTCGENDTVLRLRPKIITTPPRDD